MGITNKLTLFQQSSSWWEWLSLLCFLTEHRWGVSYRYMGNPTNRCIVIKTHLIKYGDGKLMKSCCLSYFFMWSNISQDRVQLRSNTWTQVRASWSITMDLATTVCSALVAMAPEHSPRTGSMVKWKTCHRKMRCFVFETGSNFTALGQLGTHYVDQAVLKLMDSSTPECWG